MNKQEQREMLKNIRRAMTADEVAEKSTLIAKNLFMLDEFGSAENVLLYISLPKEVGTAEIIAECIRLGKNVTVPVTTDGVITPCLLKSAEGIVTGEFGIKEPKNPKLWQGRIDIAVIPGLGFDEKGGRMGFGKGCYDRFLAENDCKRIGLCFCEMMQEQIVTEPHDLPMDMVVTEKRVIRCR